MNTEELAAIRERAREPLEESVSFAGVAPSAEQDRRALLAHIDAITEAVEGLDEPLQWIVDNYPKAMREMPTHVLRRFDAVRDLLRGTR